jgi:hypothetical protein
MDSLPFGPISATPADYLESPLYNSFASFPQLILNSQLFDNNLMTSIVFNPLSTLMEPSNPTKIFADSLFDKETEKTVFFLSSLAWSAGFDESPIAYLEEIFEGLDGNQIPPFFQEESYEDYKFPFFASMLLFMSPKLIISDTNDLDLFTKFVSFASAFLENAIDFANSNGTMFNQLFQLITNSDDSTLPSFPTESFLSKK